MENHFFLEYLMPKLYDITPAQYAHFLEDRLKRICREEGFVCVLRTIPLLAPAIRLEAKSSTTTKTFGMQYNLSLIHI